MINIEKKTKKIIIIISFLVLFLLSLGFNAYWIVRSYQEKRAISDIVNEKIDPIIDQAKEENAKINEKNEEFTQNLHNDLEDNSISVRNIDEEERKRLLQEIENRRNNIHTDENYVPNIAIPNVVTPKVEPKTIESKKLESIDAEVTHTVIIEDKAYEVKLENDIDKSHEQTIFYMDQLTMTADHYMKIIEEKDELIKNLTEQLEDAKKDITVDVTERNVNLELERFRKNFMRFGIDAYLMAGIPLSDWIESGKVSKNLLSYDFGVGWNFMLLNKYNLRLITGLEYQNTNLTPKIGVSLGYYFNN